MMRYILLLAVFLAPLTAPASASADEEGNKLFLMRCMSCHGKDGKGNTKLGKKLGAADLTDPKKQAGLTDEMIAQRIREGIKDAKTGKYRMPAMQSKFTEEQIQHVVKFVRTLVAK